MMIVQEPQISQPLKQGLHSAPLKAKPADPCGGFTGSADDDVWYQFTALTTGTVLINLDPTSGFDGVLEVFKGNCGSLSYVCMQ